MPASPKTDSTAQRVLDVLRRIEARHADQKAWCRNAYARGKNRRAVNVYGSRVVSCCLVGAVLIETQGQGERVEDRVRDRIALACNDFSPGRGPLDVNDRLGYEAVRAVERRAVELAEAALAESTP